MIEKDNSCILFELEFAIILAVLNITFGSFNKKK